MGVKMLRVVLGLYLVYTGAAFAADPPYFVDNVEGDFLVDLVHVEKAVLIPGTLDSCKTTYSTPTYSAFECKLLNAEFQVTSGTEKISFPLTQLNTSEVQYVPTEPSTLNYSFMGQYSRKLPSGATMESQTNLSIERKGATPSRFSGRLTLSQYYLLGGTFIVQLPGTP
jgi:hypothetical protein